jgi:hypothetical protein
MASDLHPLAQLRWVLTPVQIRDWGCARKAGVQIHMAGAQNLHGLVRLKFKTHSFMHFLREVDVRGELSSNRLALEKLQRQVAAAERSGEQARRQQEARVQQLEQRQLAVELRMDSVEQHLESLQAEQVGRWRGPGWGMGGREGGCGRGGGLLGDAQSEVK